MVAYVKFRPFVQNLAQGMMNLAADTMTIALSNSANIPANTVANQASLSEISSYTNFSSRTCTTTSCTQTSGTLMLILADLTLTCTSASTVIFDNIILYDSTPAYKPVICFWSYGSDVSLNSGETFTVDFDNTNGVLQIA